MYDNNARIDGGILGNSLWVEIKNHQCKRNGGMVYIKLNGADCCM